MKTFREWLLAYRRDDRIGDLADDVRRDPPPGGWDAATLADHMCGRGACREALEALDEARRSYRSADPPGDVNVFG